MSDSSPRSRRQFLAGAGAAAAVAGLAACSSDGGDLAQNDATPTLARETPTPAVVTAPTSTVLPFRVERQQGVLADPAQAGLVAAFDVVTDDKAELAAALQALSAEVERIMAGDPAVADDDFLPPSDSGAVDAALPTDGTAMTLAVGASLFDDRFGLADQRPRELIEMPLFRNDRLVDPARSSGDLALTIAGPSPQATAYALHQAVRVTERRLRVRWVQEGFNQLLPPDAERVAPTRNLMGFRDGTSNLDTSDNNVMDEWVWVGADDGEPEWAVGGSYQAVRVIRMLIEFWSTAALVRQEQIFGRHRDTGAPLGQTSELDEPAFADDQRDDAVPFRSHMRLANPRRPDTGRILRRGFSYLNGAAADGTLDQGLLFMAWQRSLSRGFFEVQSRLDGEPLEDYVKPVGGGLFFAVPGPGGGPDGWLGESLLA